MPRLQGRFAGAIRDTTTGQGGGQWSNGAQAFVTLQAQPTIARPWTILAWAIDAHGTIAYLTNPPFGKFGKVLASLMIGASISPSQVSFGQYTDTFLTPPQDALPNMVQLWDGSQDQIFPAATTPSKLGGHISATQQLPIPEQLNPADQLVIGVWITPSLVSNGVGNINLFNVSYSVWYEVRR